MNLLFFGNFNAAKAAVGIQPEKWAWQQKVDLYTSRTVREQEITNMPVIHFRHCERSAAIHGCALRAMDRHGLRPRDDEGILVISTSLRGTFAADQHDYS